MVGSGTIRIVNQDFPRHPADSTARRERNRPGELGSRKGHADVIETVTLTGIDENSDPEALIRLSRWFAFVELAVLAGTREGEPRMPTHRWIREWVTKANRADVATAIHLCGARSRAARDQNWEKLAELTAGFGRVQVNLPPPERCAAAPALDNFAQFLQRRVVVQHEGPWETSEAARCANLDLLADGSGGRGIPGFGSWPPSREGRPSGYAGGIGPANIGQALEFAARWPQRRIWIDMETGVRTSDVFDMTKAIAVCAEVEAARQRAA